MTLLIWTGAVQTMLVRDLIQDFSLFCLLTIQLSGSL